MSSANEPQIIVIKKKKKGGHDGHHGGAWKVAYADFVTAMMAFFLLLWLLNVTTDDQRQGIADYFDPANIARATSGSGGVLGGRTVGQPGQMSSPSSQFSLDRSMPGRAEPVDDATTIDDGAIDEIVELLTEGRGDELDPDAVAALLGGLSEQELGELLSGLTDQELADVVDHADLTERLREALADAGEITDTELEEALAEREQEMFEQAEAHLRQAIQSVPDLQDLAQNLLIDQTPEGLRIQIVDQEGLSMFPTGSAQMYDRTTQLLQLVAQVVAQMPQQISVSGHTDSTPFLNSDSYDNWDLSTDRANASRRAMEEGGLAPDRIALVLGKSDTDPLIADDPRNPRNRRISIVLLRQAPLASAVDRRDDP